MPKTSNETLAQTRTRLSHPVVVRVTLTQLDLSTLRGRYERLQKRHPHKANPKLTNEWIIKMAIIEAKSTEVKRIIRRINRTKA
jgi:hypothetical protein